MELKARVLLVGLFAALARPGWCAQAAKSAPKKPSTPASEPAPAPKQNEAAKPKTFLTQGTVRAVTGNAVFVDVENGFIEFRLKEGSVISQAGGGKVLTPAVLQKGKKVTVTAKEAEHEIVTVEVR
ncbi:MAG: hypothetical protein HY403_08855 [Elusimicrobia bacterium]|nr:hypothetical protein [Elusimicrobiota bacterium]